MGDVISAARVLALVEGEQELEEALQDLETGAMVLDISDLPRPGGIGEAAVRLSAARVLALVEGEQELEEALQDLETGAMVLDISDLPRPGGIGEAAVRLRREQELVSNGLHPEDMEQTEPLRLYLE